MPPFLLPHTFDSLWLFFSISVSMMKILGYT